MFSQDDLLPISALERLAFCERQWALVHLEGAWEENVFTVQGSQLHDRVHEAETEVRGDLRVARGLRLRSLRLGLIGMADAVEFHRVDSTEPAVSLSKGSPRAGKGVVEGIPLAGAEGLWRPVIVEYKRGKPKPEPVDEQQVCAQALCLEEMLGVTIPACWIFYGTPRRRHEVTLDDELRTNTEALAKRLHELTDLARTPPAQFGPKCKSCSLVDVCLPEAAEKKGKVGRYLSRAIESGQP